MTRRPAIGTGCPRCGGLRRNVSGFLVCRDCGHQAGSQNPTGVIEPQSRHFDPEVDGIQHDVERLPRGKRKPLEF